VVDRVRTCPAWQPTCQRCSRDCRQPLCAYSSPCWSLFSHCCCCQHHMIQTGHSQPRTHMCAVFCYQRDRAALRGRVCCGLQWRWGRRVRAREQAGPHVCVLEGCRCGPPAADCLVTTCCVLGICTTQPHVEPTLAYAVWCCAGGAHPDQLWYVRLSAQQLAGVAREELVRSVAVSGNVLTIKVCVGVSTYPLFLGPQLGPHVFLQLVFLYL
jgi:hypothetical protein